MNWFMYRLHPSRPDFATTMSADEQQVMGEHAAYWTAFCDSGQCLVFSPVGDPAGVWGVAVVSGGSADEVQHIGADDPAVRSGTCSFDVLPLLAPTTRS